MLSSQGPRLKKIRRLGTLPGLTRKQPIHKNDLKNSFYSEKKSQYCIRLEEKQKLRFHYGLTEQQLLRYMYIARKAKGSTSQVLLQLLEIRLDNILFRLGIASTISKARQWVTHKHILVNGYTVNIPSYRCKLKDVITLKDKAKQNRDFFSSKFHEEEGVRNSFQYQYKGLVNKILDSKFVGLKINELLVVEYYSR
uniref:Small ribosomal subunit protein uS4c n=1 Tax=Arachnitis uniflora TaxID=191246 RepID=A0A0K1H305_9LILI|nr:30S ribosomal protein S4 [Arachnitis uniflora]AKT73994.1 ribosomal protein S4 [Arachnitis uniflora]QKE31270.1 30S ribosomal protein S4 [Arachnitis uniflora]